MAAEDAEAAGSATPGARTGRRPLLSGWPTGTGLASVCLALMILPGVFAGGSLLAGAQAFLFYFGWVLVPGMACAALLDRRDDGLFSAGMGLAFGTVLVGLVVFFCRATGSFGALLVWPAATLVFWALLRRSGPAPREPAATCGGTWLFFVVLALVLVRVPTGFSGPVDEWYKLWGDLVFHGGNAAELVKEGALTDPRVAGRPLNYHLLSHALVAGMSVVTGEAIADLFRYWFLGFYPLVLVMLVFALARAFGRSAWAGLAAALALALHYDAGLGLVGEGRTTWSFQSHLDLGVFVSPTTSLGLALVVAMASVLSRWVDPGRRVGTREVAGLALLALGASMAKGSVMPPVIAGAGFAFLVQSVRGRRWSWRWLGATLVLLVAALPATLYLSLGPGSYAGAMFRFAPWATVSTSSIGKWLLNELPFTERKPSLRDGFLATLLWFPGYLGLGGVGALGWLLAGRPSLHGIGSWILGVSLAGLGAGVLLLAPGSSQLFFAYDAQVLIALVSGVGVVELRRRCRTVLSAVACAVFVLLALPFLWAGVTGIVRGLHDRAEVARNAPALWPQWCEGAAFLREKTDPESLLVANEDGLLLTQFAERRVALAAAPFTPEGHAMRWKKENGQWRIGPNTAGPFPQERRACEMALKRADKPSLARLRFSTGHTGDLYLVRTSVQVVNVNKIVIRELGDLAQFDASPGLERVFRNEAMAIYRVVD